ncbi:protein translocase subunit SecF [Candidatus Pelagibacter sp.]|nr:protein translocase subunit SecF [Candidatus Pelagibacter sp.]
MTSKYFFNKYYNLSNIISLILFIISIFFLIFKGLNYGVDFKGGTLIELRSDNTNYKTEDIRGAFNKLNLDDLSVKKFGAEGDYVIKFKRSDLNEPDFIKNLKKDLDNYLEDYNFRRVENVGPKVSAELLQDGVTAIAIALAAMLIYIWFRFEWQFSIGAIIAIFHDVIITLGIFSLLSLEINLSIVAAVLTIVGYSMNDTVVIFDRVRENLKKYADIKIFDLTNLSINETLSRTLITSVTTLLALLSIFFFGGEILKGFSFAMILGVILGTYSSIFIANPVLVYFKVSQKTLIKEED